MTTSTTLVSSATPSFNVSDLKTQFNLKIVHSPDMPPSKIKEAPYTWEQTRYIVELNELELFSRSAEQTQRYQEFKKGLKLRGITIFQYLLCHQLDWYKPEDNGNKSIEEIEYDSQIVIKPEGSKLFENDNDLKVLYNHFPYYFGPDVVHLCIWSKIPITADPESPFGDILPETRAQVDLYIDRIIVKRFGILRENLVWFKNWESLQSVKAISHIHVIIRGITTEQLKELNVC